MLHMSMQGDPDPMEIPLDRLTLRRWRLAVASVLTSEMGGPAKLITATSAGTS